MRVVVVGNGMVGSRFVDDLLTRDLDCRIVVTQLGDEVHPAYNRVLLSDVVAGRTAVGSLALPVGTDPRRRLIGGRAAVRVDRDSRRVHDAAGQDHPFDLLVLATGAAARIPALGGLGAGPGDGGPRQLPPGVQVLRSLQDANDIIAATRRCATAVVVGVGVLGVEVAAGLAARGLRVTLAASGTVMDRQFGEGATAVAALRLRAVGVTVLNEVVTEQIVLTGGVVSGVRLRPLEENAPAFAIPGDLVVLACGTVPAAGLARDAGLPVEHGVLVGEDLASPGDSAICAIGDCAQPAEGATGLIAQGWEQSRRLATRIVAGLDAGQGVGASGGSDIPLAAAPAGWPAAPTDVVKVKGDGLDLVAFGVSGPPTTAGRGAPHAVRRVTLSDPEGGRHLEVVIAGDRLIGGACIGGGQVTVDLMSAYLRRTPVPLDPAQLLVRSVVAAPEVVNPTRMPDHTTVCTCNAVSKGEIVACWSAGGRTVADVAAVTRATTGCGSCTSVVCGLLEWLREADPDDTPAPGSGEPAPADLADLPAVDGRSYLPETPPAPLGNAPLVASTGFRPVTHGPESHQLQGST